MTGIKSDVGMVRQLNEDYAKFVENEIFKAYVVADGMGGHNAGEVASKMATEKIVSYIEENFNDENKEEILKKAVLYANKEVYGFSHKEEEYTGMGTTLTACLITNEKIQVANVGDSSCFGIIKNKIEKITKDHSLVQELLDLGTINEEQASKHPQKNVITRAIGTKNWVDIDVFNIEFGKFETLMLCSDGLSNEVNKDEILSVIKESDNFDTACEKLVDIAKSRGGRDNITVMLFEGEV
ncbi:MAG: Stp1/IreP family PP2C-type Ser/Thr phosphatase [Clostridium sp.]